MEAPHAGRLFLHWDHAAEQWLLQHVSLGLMVGLPQGPAWQLDFDSDGAGFIAAPCADGSQQTEWASDLFDYALVVEGDSAALNVIGRDGSRMALQDFRASHTTLEVPLRESALAHTWVVIAYRLRRSWGAFCFWSLKSLRNCFVSDESCTASAWYQNWWVWWDKYLNKLGMNATEHLRRPVRTQHEAKKQKAEPKGDLDVRVFEEAAVSSYGMVALVVKWCSPSVTSKPKTENVRVVWERCLQCIVDTFLVLEQPVAWPIALSQDAVAMPGLPISGGRIGNLVVAGGEVCVSRLRGLDWPVLTDLLSNMQCFEERAKLVTFMQRLHIAGKKGVWLFKQMVWHIGAALEGALVAGKTAADMADEGLADACASLGDEGGMGQSRLDHERSKRRLKKKGRFAIKVARVVGQSRCIAKYFFCTRRVFHRPHHLSIAVDASRVSKKDYLVGAAGLPNGVLVWLPPQATYVCALVWGTQGKQSGGCTGMVFQAHKEFSRDIARFPGTQGIRSLGWIPGTQGIRARHSPFLGAHKENRVGGPFLAGTETNPRRCPASVRRPRTIWRTRSGWTSCRRLGERSPRRSGSVGPVRRPPSRRSARCTASKPSTGFGPRAISSRPHAAVRGCIGNSPRRPRTGRQRMLGGRSHSVWIKVGTAGQPPIG